MAHFIKTKKSALRGGFRSKKEKEAYVRLIKSTGKTVPPYPRIGPSSMQERHA